MKEIVSNSAFFGVLISLLSYFIGLAIKKRINISIVNPLLIGIVIAMIIVSLLDIDYNKYYDGAKYISYLLTPATVCLAVPLYEQINLLKKNIKAILFGVFSGVITSLCCVLLFAIIFGLTHTQYVTLLPKSITTAIGMAVSDELGGTVTITVAVIVITGIVGNIIAETVCKLFRIKDNVAKGIAIGTASHAIGTTKAMEIGKIEGAMSSLAIAVTGIMTVIFASVFSNFY